MFSASKTAAPVSGSYSVKQSLRFRSSASANLNRTPSVAGNRQTWTWSGWVKRGTLGVQQSFFSAGTLETDDFFITFQSDDTIRIIQLVSSSATLLWQTTQVFRDASAWYHVVIKIDTTQATSANRVAIYINGSQVTAFSTQTTPAQNTNLLVNSATPHGISRRIGSSTLTCFDGYLAEVNFIDGQALTPSSFGATNATTGVWQPAKYTGSYGTNGFYLTFGNTTSTTTLGYDTSGNGNNWTTNNISLTAGSTYDSMLDSPTNYDNGGNGVGNYAVLNPLSNPNGPIFTLSNANLNYSCSASSGNGPKMAVSSSMGMSSGKWYCEAVDTSGNSFFAVSSGLVAGGTANGLQYAGVVNGGTYQSAATYSGTTPTFTSSDVIGMALDAGAKTLAIYKNGVLLGTFSGLESSVNIWFFLQTVNTGSAATSSIWNFGQRPFSYTPPSGYKALNTQNLSAPAIVKGSAHMNVALDTGANIKTTSQALYTYYLEWIKDRANVNNNQLADTVRGNTAILQSNTTAAETTYTAPSGNSVGWVWNANAAAVTNTSGTITSQVSANTTAGFSVVTYTGSGSGSSTVGHGLGVAPSMIIIKNRTTATSWPVMHTSMPTNGNMFLDLTQAYQTTYAQGGIASPANSTIFGFVTGSSGGVQVYDSGKTYVAYCFAAIAGYSAFGSYTGNGSTDGPFVYCGFQPKFVLVKCSSTTGNWYIFDSARNTYNVLGEQLEPNLSNAGSTITTLDFLSNGFKLRIATDPNAAQTYIYAAFASSPFKNSLAF